MSAATMRAAFVVGLIVFVAGLVVGGEAGGRLLAVGELVTLAALIRIGDQSAAARFRRTYRYLRCRCGRRLDDSDGGLS